MRVDVLRDDARGARVTYDAAALGTAEADSLLARMLAAPWQAERLRIYGVERTARRLTCAFGDAGTRYTYSGSTKTPHPFGELEGLRAALSEAHGVRFNFALANLYPDGQAGIAAHADDERDIAPGSPIVGVSLGAARDFVLYLGRERVASVELGHGSAVAMLGATQEHYRHAVPPRLRVKAPRVSLTFRCIVTSH